MVAPTPEMTGKGYASTNPTSAAEFEGLLRRSYGRAYSAAYRMMGNATDAEDLTQEAFMRVWAAFDRYDRSRPFEGWLFRILNNLAIDRWRRHSVASVCSLDAESSRISSGSARGRAFSSNDSSGGRGPSLLSCLADERPAAMPEQAYLRAETGRRVRRALSALPPDYRAVVLLADVQGYSYEEIAGKVGCPVGTIRSRLHRGRQLLRQQFLKLQNEEENASLVEEKNSGTQRANHAFPLLAGDRFTGHYREPQYQSVS